jgi:hypothetical protein
MALWPLRLAEYREIAHGRRMERRHGTRATHLVPRALKIPNYISPEVVSDSMTGRTYAVISLSWWYKSVSSLRRGGSRDIAMVHSSVNIGTGEHILV